MITPVIISGGSGTRLWPLSRKARPKQFLNLINSSSIFQNTIQRLPQNIQSPIVVCNEDHRFLVAEQLREINCATSGIILEPTAKNTAPAITLAALKLSKNNQNDPILLVLPADHSIEDIRSFHSAIEIGKDLAMKNKLITFGIQPTSPDTGYGYIEANIDNNNPYSKIKSFNEKPNEKIANTYFKSGRYLWNSGMFMFKCSVFLKELEKFQPKILDACKKSFAKELQDHDFIRLINNEFLKCPNLSVDYAVMENTSNSFVIPLDANWSDIGSWDSLMKSKSKDSFGNAIDGDVVLQDVENSFIYSSNRLISAVGVKNLIVVDTSDALLVLDKSNSQNVKDIVSKLQRSNRPELSDNRKVFRPWGYFDSIDIGKTFQVKRICVKPGEKISLQKHRHRSEHWVVVSGIGKITCGNEIFNLKENESTYIPKGEIHRLENDGDINLEIIEIQTGDYLGEDDIIRFEDDYQRD
ncbi:mannose-1-phosphate guanylyltransferase/mannose-6-phosphate isomerase [Pseudothioglobus sp. nBUS_23]|uniref:mannose-1-phosphate guanylyltransferase/mannose-6-phosphate isomerase n=1 Tax=Pseudothioglobus sp. nBUS_23 TaxID=3395318 RepID=UPI003EBD3781